MGFLTYTTLAHLSALPRIHSHSHTPGKLGQVYIPMGFKHSLIECKCGLGFVAAPRVSHALGFKEWTWFTSYFVYECESGLLEK